MSSKRRVSVLSASQAAALVRNNWTIATSGFGGFGHPEAITRAMEQRFLKEGGPRGLTLLFAASNGDRESRGMNHFGGEGMVRRVIAGGWRGTPRLGALALQNSIEAYNWPQGVISQLFRAIAAGQPGVITRTGLHTFVDPRVAGGRLNAATSVELVKLVEIGGEPFLLYPTIDVQCAFIRATSSDRSGNLSLEHEAFPQDMLAIAQASKNCGGTVIAQVKRLVEDGELDATRVRVPGILVDHVVIAERPEEHWMSFGEVHNPAYIGEHAGEAIPTGRRMELDAARIIQRRALKELLNSPGAVINIGIGIPSGIAALARELDYSDFTPTIESGVIGGIAADELSFGAAAYPEAVIEQAAQFDFYSGGGLDLSFLGMLELDLRGDVNVGKVGDQIIGVGGFIDISQNAKRVCFLGTFSAGGLRVAARDGKLSILQEGRAAKIVEQVEQIAFCACNAPYGGARVRYITERAVFGVRDGVLTLLEIAPGIDAERDVLARLPRGVQVASDLAMMDSSLFQEHFPSRQASSGRLS